MLINKPFNNSFSFSLNPSTFAFYKVISSSCWIKQSANLSSHCSGSGFWSAITTCTTCSTSSSSKLIVSHLRLTFSVCISVSQSFTRICIVWSANLCSVVGYSPILFYTCSTLCLHIFLIIWSFLIQYSITTLFILLLHIFPQFWIRRLMTTWYSKPAEHDTCQMRHFNHLRFQSR